MAHIVEGVTKISRIDFASREEAQAENVRKMMLAMVDDIRVVLIKLADRLHNMRTLEPLSPERQVKIAKETLEIYAPLAHRLGMGKVRGELEDLAFPYVDPVGYKQVFEQVEAGARTANRLLARMEANIRAKLKENNIEARVDVAHQAPVLHLPEAATAEDHGRPDVRPAGAAHHHPLGQ